jgi:hypothetical protein
VVKTYFIKGEKARVIQMEEMEHHKHRGDRDLSTYWLPRALFTPSPGQLSSVGFINSKKTQRDQGAHPRSEAQQIMDPGSVGSPAPTPTPADTSLWCWECFKSLGSNSHF